jgi:hypothetical protein
MQLIDFEKMILDEMDKTILKIINDYPELNISAKSRAGAELSDFLEEKFVEYSNKSGAFVACEKSPKGATKNPWDARALFSFKQHKETIWIDFKAIKISGKDSSPDIGTPTKVINLIKDGNFYLLYVYVFYDETNSGLKFMKVNGKYVKSYFLKDIHHTFRRNPKNQLQVNVSQPPEYRTREEFIKLLIEKLKESHERQIIISQKALEKLSKEEDLLLEINRKTEARILNNLK